MAISILMSIYTADKPEQLKEALDSISRQTLQPDEIVIVEDGPLKHDLYSVLDEFTDRQANVRRLRLSDNHGLGFSLSKGLEMCNYQLVARMDTDDVCKFQRLEKQEAYMRDHPEVDVLGTWVDEFYETTSNVVSVRKVPESSSELYEFGKRRNPMNHPTVMFRKDSVLRAGNYQTCMLLEDYYLWARMLQKGMVFHNIQEPLLYFRLSSDIYKRRGGIRYAMREVRFQLVLHKIGYITIPETIRNIATRFFVRLLPPCLRRYVYRHLLRR